MEVLATTKKLNSEYSEMFTLSRTIRQLLKIFLSLPPENVEHFSLFISFFTDAATGAKPKIIQTSCPNRI